MAPSTSPAEFINSFTEIETILTSLITAAGSGVLSKKMLHKHRRKLILATLKLMAGGLFHKKSEGTAHAAMMYMLIFICVLLLIGFFISWWLALSLFVALMLYAYISEYIETRRIN